MEHYFEKHPSSSLNFVLICRDFVSPAALRLYLESKGCTVVQQDDTLVGIGATLPYASRAETQAYGITHAAARREVEIHAYLRTPLNWKADWASALHHTDRRQEFGTAHRRPAGDREDHLCLVFARATYDGDRSSHATYHFFEEALEYVRAAYMQYEQKHASHTDATLQTEESKPVKDSVHLTAREHEILKWVSEGKGCWETGAILGISERTVKFHLQNIYRKLNVVNRAQAITKAMRYALI